MRYGKERRRASWDTGEKEKKHLGIYEGKRRGIKAFLKERGGASRHF